MIENYITPHVKERANAIRNAYIDNCEKHLLAFEQKLNENRINVFWVIDEHHLKEVITSFFPKSLYNKVCFDMKQIPEDFHSFGTVIKTISLENLENNVENVDFLITEADFAVIESGNIILSNKKSKHSFNNVENLVIILDINKLVIKENDIETILYLRSLLKEETILPQDVKIISAPYKRVISSDIFSSESQNYTQEEVPVYLLLYDNGISDLLENKHLHDALLCIDCDKCKNVCPVFNITQQYTPIDLIKPENDNVQENARRIMQNCTFCGNCDAICPVKISFTSLMVKELEIAKSKHIYSISSNLYQRFSKRSKMNKINNKVRRYFFLKRYYGKNKKLTHYFLSQQEDFFNIQWQENEKRD